MNNIILLNILSIFAQNIVVFNRIAYAHFHDKRAITLIKCKMAVIMRESSISGIYMEYECAESKMWLYDNIGNNVC